MILSSIIFRSVVMLTSVMSSSNGESDDYLKRRNEIMKTEKTLYLGGKIKLTQKEEEANKVILREKMAELARGYKNSSEFLPARHFFQAKDEMERSKVFGIIRKLPKGASLHTHMLAAVSADYVIKNITYRENIYGGWVNGAFKLKFLESPDQDNSTEWVSLKTRRDNSAVFDDWLKKQLTLNVPNPYEVYTTPESVWVPLKRTFTTLFDLVSYKPVFGDYIYQLLKELYLDNVTYAELRCALMTLYELDGTKYDNKEFFRVFVDAVNQFKNDHPKFLGVRYIHSVYRGATPEVLQANIDELIELQKLYPNFIAGLDLVGYEAEKQLVDFHEVLLNASKDLTFFFHAGETSQYGHTDLNLVDVILLNTSRIGHGTSLTKHPVLVDMAKEKRIPLELCPISNQVLLLNQDPRNHPVVPLMATGFPVVICNDDPSVWEATGLSYDWYVVFMAMTPQNAGIEVLKQFAMDSIAYSAMGDGEKLGALEKWKQDWRVFLDEVLQLEQQP